MKIPELLLPAGNLEKLKVAVLYGANAVYVGGQKFGLRAAADNFTEPELREGMEFAHARGVQVYVVLNGFLHDQDLRELPPFLRFLEEVGTDAVIVSDLGVMKTVKAHSRLPIHLSTQASCLNEASARFWGKMGAKRVIVGRELSVEQTAQIKRASGLEVEMFIHGSMCMSYSGHCTISNYTQGRDSNRGGCAHSCRFEYSLNFSSGPQCGQAATSYFMSSKDLSGPSVIPLFVEREIDSIKVEGRMKSPLYVGTVAKVYREALNRYQEKGLLTGEELFAFSRELEKMAHRDYSTASLLAPAGMDSIYDEREGEDGHRYVGQILDIQSDGSLILEVRNTFLRGEKLELIPFQGKVQEVDTTQMLDLMGVVVEKTRPSTLVKLPGVMGAQRWNFLRQEVQA